jgi:multidrug efflux pump
MGVAVFAGMLGVTFFGLFLTPVFYVLVRRFVSGKKAPVVPSAEPGLEPAHGECGAPALSAPTGEGHNHA